MSTITNLITLKSRNSITALFQRAGSCGPSPRPSRENIMLHLRGIGKSFVSGGDSDGGGEQNKTGRKVERLVVAFKRVAKKFRRRMETLVAHRRAGATSPLSLSLPRLRPFATPCLAQQSATPLSASSIGPKCHEIKLVFDRLGISFASAVRVPANAPRTRPSRDSIKSIGRVG